MTDIGKELHDLIYNIPAAELPSIAPAWRPSRKQRKKLRRLKRAGNRKALRRYRRKLRRAQRRFALANDPHCAERLLTDWLVAELTDA